MEALFPALLTYSFFAPLVLRIGMAVVFFAEARAQWKKERPHYIASTVSLVVGLFLFFGSLTQGAALAGLVYLAVVMAKKDPSSAFSGKIGLLLSAIVLLSLLLTGPGFPLFPSADKPY
ncbi:MAG: hypothetical protein JO026_00150 [Patescibacteria group bacterium]|nr:hypothetical protein [Patescibacteria group bacterium]